MILYCYDSTGLYVGPISPRLDAAKPFDADGTPRFLHPKNATATPPPTVQSGYAAVFNAQAGTWSLVEDHRGEIVYSTTTGYPERVAAVGAVPTGYTLLPRPSASHIYQDALGWVFDLNAARESAKVAVDATAESLRSTVITPGSGQLWSYIDKWEEAKAFQADASPTAEKYPYIYGAVGTTDGTTAAEVAETYIRCGALWRSFGPMIENVRRRAKDAIATATSQAAIDAIISGAQWPTLGG